MKSTEPETNARPLVLLNLYQIDLPTSSDQQAMFAGRSPANSVWTVVISAMWPAASRRAAAAPWRADPICLLVYLLREGYLFITHVQR